jgi:hypothetical protein
MYWFIFQLPDRFYATAEPNDEFAPLARVLFQGDKS